MDSEVKEIECIQLSKSKRQVMRETVAIESKLTLYIQNKIVAKFNHSPGFRRELIFGFLLSTGRITRLSDVSNIVFDASTCNISLSERNQSKSSRSSHQVALSWDTLMKIRNLLLQNQKHHSATGGFHSAVIYEVPTGRWFSCEDIGRHNAIDKVLGHALGKKYSFSESVLFLTGRLTSEIVSKSSQAGIAAIASLTVATSTGIKIAEDIDMTLLGSVSSDNCWLYHEGIMKVI